MENKMLAIIVAAVVVIAAAGVAVWYFNQGGNNEKASYDLAKADGDIVDEALFSEYNEFKGDNYTWFFADDAKIDGPIDLTVKSEAVSAELFGTAKLAEVADKCCKLIFDHDGDLPDGAKLRLFVGTEYADDLRAFYEDGGDADPLYLTVDKDGFVNIEMSHCSDWILAPACKVTINYSEGIEPIKDVYVVYGTSDVPVDINVKEGFNIDTLTAETETGMCKISSGNISVEVTDHITITLNVDKVKVDPETPVDPEEPAPLYYTVTYDYNGGVGTLTSDSKYETGDDVKLLFSPAPTREGYKFLGWSDSKDASDALYKSDSDTLTITKNIVLFAVWEKIDDGGDEPSDVVKEKNGNTYVYSYEMKYNDSELIELGKDTVKGTLTLTISNVSETGYTMTMDVNISGLTIPTNSDVVSYDEGIGGWLDGYNKEEGTITYDGNNVQCFIITGIDNDDSDAMDMEYTVGLDGIVYKITGEDADGVFTATLTSYTR